MDPRLSGNLLGKPVDRDFARSGQARFNVALLQLPQLANPHISVDEVLEEARLAREDADEE